MVMTNEQKRVMYRQARALERKAKLIKHKQHIAKKHMEKTLSNGLTGLCEAQARLKSYNKFQLKRLKNQVKSPDERAVKGYGKDWARDMGLSPHRIGEHGKAIFDVMFKDKNGVIKTRNASTNPSESPMAGISFGHGKKLVTEKTLTLFKPVKHKAATMALGEKQRYDNVVTNYHKNEGKK